MLTRALYGALLAAALGFGSVAIADREGSCNALLLGEDREFEGVYASWLGEYAAAEHFDETALREALDGLTVRRLTGIGALAQEDGTWLELVLFSPDGLRYLTLHQNSLRITGYRGAASESYVLLGAPDWDALRAAAQ